MCYKRLNSSIVLLNLMTLSHSSRMRKQSPPACINLRSLVRQLVILIILEKHTYPWYKIKAFRNFILHEYHGIEMKVVWDAAINFLPDLKEVMERILREEF